MTVAERLDVLERAWATGVRTLYHAEAEADVAWLLAHVRRLEAARTALGDWLAVAAGARSCGGPYGERRWLELMAALAALEGES